MMLQPTTNFMRFIQLLFISFVTASLFIVMLSFDPNSVESPTRLTFWEKVIMVPLVFTLYFIPFVIVIGCITLFIKAAVEKILNVQHIMLDSIVYVSCSIIVIPILPDMITNAATSTGYQFFINPYYLLPFTGAVLLIGFDYFNKKGSLCELKL